MLAADSARKRLKQAQGRQENLMAGHQQALQQSRQSACDDREVITQLTTQLAAAREEIKTTKSALQQKSAAVVALEKDAKKESLPWLLSTTS